MQTIGLVGCGNMGSAVARAMSVSPKMDVEIMVFDADTDRAAILASEISGTVASSLESLQRSSDITLLAVKPQVLPDLYPLLSQVPDKPYISVAAGVSLETLCAQTGSQYVARFMPNVAASVSRAVTAVAFTPECGSEFRSFCLEAAGSFGTALELPESQFSAFIGISGSAIAFFYQFLHAVALGGTREGIAYPTSVSLAADTFSGAVELLRASGSDPVALLTTVLSAGGTTVEGLHRLEQGFTGEVMDAVHASAEKARTLEQSARGQQNTLSSDKDRT